MDTSGVWKRPVSEFLGLQDQQLEDSISLFPNPTDGLLHIKTGNILDLFEMTIYDIRGHKIITENFSNTSSVTLHFEASPGIYLVKICGSDKSLGVWKIIKE
jgi:hypothetical protein